MNHRLFFAGLLLCLQVLLLSGPLVWLAAGKDSNSNLGAAVTVLAEEEQQHGHFYFEGGLAQAAPCHLLTPAGIEAPVSLVTAALRHVASEMHYPPPLPVGIGSLD